MTISFTLDEQIVLRNEETNKTYTIVINQDKGAYNVTREWTIPEDKMAAKTDRFVMFSQAATHFNNLYQERISHGYIEVLRKSGVIKTADKIEKHKAAIPKQSDKEPVRTGKEIEKMVTERHRTGIWDRIKW